MKLFALLPIAAMCASDSNALVGQRFHPDGDRFEQGTLEECPGTDLDNLPEQGEVLLQQKKRVRRSVSVNMLHEDSVAAQEPGTPADAEEQARVNGIELSEVGYAIIQAECCLHSFDLFARRIIAHMGMEICDEGCFNGFIPFFSCGKSQTMQSFMDSIKSKSREYCACFKPAGHCAGGLPLPCLEANTGVYDASAHRRRHCASSTVVTTSAPSASKFVLIGEGACNCGGKFSGCTYTDVAADSRIECETHCKEGCVGYEYNSDSKACKIHTTTIVGVDAATATACYVVQITTTKEITTTSTITTTTTPTITTTTEATTTITTTTTMATTTTTTSTITSTTTTTATTSTTTTTPPSTTTTETTTTSITSTTATKASTTTSSTTTGATTTTTTTPPATTTSLQIDCEAGLLNEATSCCNQAMQSDPEMLEILLNQCLSEVCSGGSENASAICQKYNVSGDPVETCPSDVKEVATITCVAALRECDLTEEWLEACVADVCAADQAGVSNPYALAEGYCELQVVPDELPTEAPTTTTSTYLAVSPLCQENMFTINLEVDSVKQCLIKPTHSECKYFDMTKGPGRRRTGCNPTGTVGPPCTRPQGILGQALFGKPNGCVMRFDAAENPPGDSGRLMWNTAEGGTGDSDPLWYRVCCGSEEDVYIYNGPTTTKEPGPTTTPEPESVLPPLRPPVDPSVAIQRPANAKLGLCKVYGDPHFKTFDSHGSKDNFDMYKWGTYWIVKSPAIWIQGNYGSRNMRSYLRKIAVGGPFLQGNTMMIEEGRSWWNDDGEILPTAGSTWSGLNGAITATRKGNDETLPMRRRREFTIHFPDDVTISLKIDPFYYMTATISMRQINGQDGHCGNFNGVGDGSNEVGVQGPVAAAEKLIPY